MTNRFTVFDTLSDIWSTFFDSISGSLKSNQALVARRPFHSPHHTISDVGLFGGGTNSMPGSVSLAHNGVLFLDELPEFQRSVLEVMRQPLEDGEVTIAYLDGSETIQANHIAEAIQYRPLDR